VNQHARPWITVTWSGTPSWQAYLLSGTVNQILYTYTLATISPAFCVPLEGTGEPFAASALDPHWTKVSPAAH
jgi:hypothetical protein